VLPLFEVVFCGHLEQVLLPIAATTELHVPTAHCVHFVFPEGLLVYSPIEQFLHCAMARSWENVPGGHSIQVDKPGVEKKPASQTMQNLLAPSEYLPASQSTHDFCPFSALCVPGGQSWHELTPAFEN